MSSREQSLKKALADVMEIDADEVSLTRSFADQGLDSLAGLRYSRKIQDLLDAEIELEWLFDHPTISQLSEFLDRQFGGAVADPGPPD